MRRIYEQPKKLLTEGDRLTIQTIANHLVEVGLDDDVLRFQEMIKAGDSFEKACEIAIIYIKYSQDLKHELEYRRMGGYL